MTNGIGIRGIGIRADFRRPRGRALLVATVLSLSPIASAQVTPNPAADPQATTKSVDAALAELASLSADGTESSVLFGVPAPTQRLRAGEAAKRSLDLLDQAQTSAAAAIKHLEDGTMGRGADRADGARRAAAVEEALARLVDVEQAQRIPFARGWAMTIQAGAAEGAARAEAARGAIDTLSSLRLAGSGAEASRRVVLVAAILNSGPGGSVDDAARSAISAALGAIDAADGALDSRTKARLVLIRRVLGGAMPPEPGAATDAETSEAVARGLLIDARRSPQRRVELTADACKALLEPLHTPGTTANDSAIRLVVYSKVASIIEPGIDPSRLPPEAALARAVTLFRGHADSVEARALLTQIVSRADADPALKATALWEDAAAHMRISDADAGARAAESLDKIVTDFPGDVRAAAAARSQESIAGRLARAEGVTLERRAAWEQMQLRALDLLIAHPDAFPSQFGEWKSRSIALRVRRMDAATATAEQVGPQVDLEATIERPRPSPAGGALSELFRKMIDSPAWANRPAPERLALLKVIRRARDPLADDRLALFAGEAQLELGHAAEAAADLRPLIGGRLDQPDEPTRPRVRLAYVRALAGAGLSESTRQEALTVLRQLTAPLDESVVSSPRPEWYWRAWAESVEIAAGDVGAAASVPAQIKRLEVIDPGLGGHKTSERFAAVRKAIETPAK